MYAAARGPWGKRVDTEISKQETARWHSLDNLLWKKLWRYRVTN